MLDLGSYVCCKNCKNYESYHNGYSHRCPALRHEIDIDIGGDGYVREVEPSDENKFFCSCFEKV